MLEKVICSLTHICKTFYSAMKQPESRSGVTEKKAGVRLSKYSNRRPSHMDCKVMESLSIRAPLQAFLGCQISCVRTL